MKAGWRRNGRALVPSGMGARLRTYVRVGCSETSGAAARPDDVAAMATEHIEAEIERLAAGIAATSARWLLLIGEYDARDGWWTWHGVKSAADWVSWRCAVAPRAAREQVRVARALRELPVITAAFCAGELSYSKARALTRVATADSEEELLEIARHATAAQLERILAGYRRATTDDAERARRLRFFDHHWDQDGSLRFEGSLPPEEGALLLRALEAGLDLLREQFRDEAGENGEENGSAEPFSEREQERERPRQSDALGLLAETFLANGPAELRGGERFQVILHSRADGRFHLADGPALPAATAERLGCDSSVVALTERDGEPLSVGRRTRTVPAAIRRALEARDGGCRFPGCESRRFLDAHHVHHWAAGGETSQRNLVLLCRRHHRLVHEGGYSLGLGPSGELEIRAPDGRRIEARPRLRLDPAFRVPSRAGPILTGSGERADLGMCVDRVLSVTHPRAG